MKRSLFCLFVLTFFLCQPASLAKDSGNRANNSSIHKSQSRKARPFTKQYVNKKLQEEIAWSAWHERIDRFLERHYEALLAQRYRQSRTEVVCTIRIRFVVTRDSKITERVIVEKSPKDIPAWICLGPLDSLYVPRSSFKNLLAFPAQSDKKQVEKTFYFSHQYGRLLSHLSNQN